MTKSVATAIFAGPYGGEDKASVKRTMHEFAESFLITAPGYVRKRFRSVEAARAFVERCHNFIRWA